MKKMNTRIKNLDESILVTFTKNLFYLSTVTSINFVLVERISGILVLEFFDTYRYTPVAPPGFSLPSFHPVFWLTSLSVPLLVLLGHTLLRLIVFFYHFLFSDLLFFFFHSVLGYYMLHIK